MAPQGSGSGSNSDNDDDGDDGDGSDDVGSEAAPPTSERWAVRRPCPRLSIRQLRKRASMQKQSRPVHHRIKGTDFHYDVGAATGDLSIRFARMHNTALIRSKFRCGRLGLNPLQPPHRAFLSRECLPVKHTATKRRFGDYAFCGTYSEDGTMFMSACQDDMLRLYNTQTPSWSLRRSVHARDVGWAVVDTCYSPNQEYLIYSSWSSAIRLITLEGDRHEDLRFSDYDGRSCPFSIRFSQDSSMVLAGLNQGVVLTYDINRDMVVKSFEAHSDDANAVAFTDASTNVFISGSDDALCKVWDLRTVSNENPQPVRAFRGHTHGITYIDSKGDGKYFLSQGKDSSVKLWDLRTVPENETAPAVSMFDYRWMNGGNAHGVRRTGQRRLRGDASVMTYRGHTVARTLLRARFSPTHSTGQRFVYSGCARGRVYVWDTLTGDVLSNKTVHEAIVRDVSWHPFKPIIASSSWDGTIKTSSFAPEPESESSSEQHTLGPRL